jgi:hypothetical protein
MGSAMSEGKDRNSTEIELLKIEIYSERSHSVLTTKLSYSVTSVVGILVLLYTLYYSQKISDIAFFLSVVILMGLLLFYSRKITKAYEEDFTKISKMIENVNNGKSLPELEKLKKWKI